MKGADVVGAKRPALFDIWFQGNNVYCHSNVRDNEYVSSQGADNTRGAVGLHGMLFLLTYDYNNLKRSNTANFRSILLENFRSKSSVLKYIEKGIMKLKNFLIGNNKAYSIIAKILF